MISQSGPQRYISDINAYQQLPAYITELGVNHLIFLHGTKSLSAAQPYLADFPLDVTVTDVLFSGECSYEEITRVKQIVTKQHAQMIIGLGGGKVLDTAKSVATGTSLKLVLIPTLASNCAPWSALSVHYKENGEHVDHKIYKETADLMLLNPEVILRSPINYFVAGIADTLAKYYESELIFEQLPEENYTTALDISRLMANKCKEILLKYSTQAITDMKVTHLTHVWRKVAETIIVTAGTVGGWGDSYARSTGAHAVHDALTLFPQTSSLLHGEKVGYGILVQLAIEKHFEEIKRLLPFYREIGVPVNFHDLNLDGINDADITKIARESADKKTTMNLIPVPINTQVVKNAMIELEKIAG